MSGKLGENLQSEWDEDPAPRELWDALQEFKSGQMCGLAKLKELAKNGSSLSMMYVGAAYINGKPPLSQDLKVGEHWLRKSASAGSTEAAFGLAKHLIRTGHVKEAMAHLEMLSSSYYSPAAYVIGEMYYRGIYIKKDTAVAKKFLSFAENLGHLKAKVLLSHILITNGSGLHDIGKGIIKRVSSVPSIAHTVWTFKDSDKLKS